MNLPDLIKTGESTTVEFKERFDERCIESLVAFANTRGGVIFIGVSDKNNIKGINIGKETINQWVNQISLSTDPRLIPEIEKIQIDGKTVIAVQVKEYPEVCNTSERTSSRDLAELVSSRLFEPIRITGKSTAYILRRHNDAIKMPKTPSDINEEL